MVLDITLFRKEGGCPDLVYESQKRRYGKKEQIDTVIEADERLKKAKYAKDQQREQLNKVQKQITEKMKNKENADDLKKEKEKLEKSLPELEEVIEKYDNELNALLRKIGNIVHASVPISDNEDNNELIRTWGETPRKPRQHQDLLWMIDGFDANRGSKVAGHRGYFLKGPGVRLNLALIQYGLDFLNKRKYTEMQTPFFMLKEPMAATAQLEEFDDALYKLVGGAKDEASEKYLIATSEQPISAFHKDEWLTEKQLPIKYAGYSTCFRKEAGAYGKDVRGIFRVHQFEKVEQFCITTPEESWDLHEEMIRTSEEFFQSLGIPYRVVSIVSGALNNAASKKYDLEGWLPGYGEFRELCSVSNCTDYQARSLEVRCGVKKQGDKTKRYVHMLNGTLCATTRAICAILENHQTDKGIKVPAALVPYMGGTDFIPFVQEALKEEEPATTAKKDDKKEAKPAAAKKEAPAKK